MQSHQANFDDGVIKHRSASLSLTCSVATGQHKSEWILTVPNFQLCGLHLEFVVAWNQNDNSIVGHQRQGIKRKPALAVVLDGDPWPGFPPVPLLVKIAQQGLDKHVCQKACVHNAIYVKQHCIQSEYSCHALVCLILPDHGKLLVCLPTAKSFGFSGRGSYHPSEVSRMPLHKV